ncbi:unnamed protein product [Brassica rapa]|uniref:J domain-containing protein n=1 Tax=Brassica campestris TaxID=3711 RepID=A0A3P6AZF9_BRACM|nr:unnamed protein product [Brassica rapa]VDC89561.1 unnamed protein product [Brassica rapa]
MEQLDTRAPVDCDDFLDLLHTKSMSHETQVLDPFSILGLEPGVSDSDIKKAYRRLSIQYHPDKNPDPEANKYFVESISKAYQALTDPLSRENFDKYGHPDGRQGFQMGIALPRFLLDIDGASAKLWKFFTKAAEYMEIPVRRTDDEPLQKVFMSVRSELNLDLKSKPSFGSSILP